MKNIVERLKTIIKKEVKPEYIEDEIKITLELLDFMWKRNKAKSKLLFVVTSDETALCKNLGAMKNNLDFFETQPAKYFFVSFTGEVREVTRQTVEQKIIDSEKQYNSLKSDSMNLI